jgi:hypothetical protein
MGADSCNTLTLNTLLFDMNAWVKFFLLMITATRGGSEVT